MVMKLMPEKQIIKMVYLYKLKGRRCLGQPTKKTGTIEEF
jgi:hypothetical protein